MDNVERIRDIWRQKDILTSFRQHEPAASPIGNLVDVVFTTRRIVFVRADKQPDVSRLDAFGAVGALASAVINKCHSITKNRALDLEVVDQLIANGLAMAALSNDIACEIQEEKKSLWELNMFSWAERESWVTFWGLFTFQDSQLQSSFSFKESASTKNTKKKIQDNFPIRAIIAEEKLPLEALFKKWNNRVY